MAACAALAALAVALPASATVLYSTNFASPTFTTGALAGQDGWGTFTPSGGVTVQDNVTDDGEPAVDLGSGGAAYYLYGPITPTGLITVSADINVASSSSSIIIFGAIGSSTVFDSADHNFDFAAGVTVLGGLRAIPATSTKTTSFSFNAWHNVSMTLDYATQTYDVAVDGQLLSSNIPFCGYELNSNTCTGVQSSKFEGIELVQPNGLKSGAIYLGDVSISEVPEPTTWAMMLAGFALTSLTLRRRPLAA
jgi:hypothetical protein